MRAFQILRRVKIGLESTTQVKGTEVLLCVAEKKTLTNLKRGLSDVENEEEG